MTARLAARNLSAISMHKGAQLAGAFGFAAIIPRALGPELFGQLSFVLSLALILQMAGDLGGMDIMGRYVPGWQHEGGAGEQRSAWLAWQLTWLRLLIGLVITLALTFTAPLLAPWLSSAQGALIGLSVLFRLLAWTPFHLCFGLNQMGRWSVELSWRQAVMIPFLLVLLPWGLTGLLIGLVLSELVFLVLGVLWTRPYLQPRRFDWAGTRPYLRFGAGFFVANIVLVSLYRSSPVLLELLTRNTVAVGYLNLALNIYMMFLVIFTHYIASFVPALTRFHAQGQSDLAQRWLERLMRYAAVLVGIFVIGLVLLSKPVAPLLFGQEYAAVADLLVIFGLALLAQPAIWAVRYASTSFGHSRAPFYASLAGLIAYLIASLALIPKWQATGATLGLTVGVLVLGVVSVLMSRAWLIPPWRAWLAAYLPLMVLPFARTQGLIGAIVLTALAITGYLILLWALRVLTTAEARQVLTAFRPARHSSAAG